MKISEEFQQVMKKEKSRANKNIILQKSIKKYNELKNKGFIVDEKYNILRTDLTDRKMYHLSIAK